MTLFSMNDGIIVNLDNCRQLIPYTDGSYRLVWFDDSFTDLIGADASAFTTYLTGKIVVKRVLTRPILQTVIG